MCKIKQFSILLPYIFVLDSLFLFSTNMYTEGIVRMHVYFCSQQNIVRIDIRSVLLYGRYNITFKQIQYTFIIIIYSNKNKLSPCNIIIILNNNKLSLNDQIKCFVINACIFLFSTMILTACWFALYILGLDHIKSDCFYCIRVTI